MPRPMITPAPRSLPLLVASALQLGCPSDTDPADETTATTTTSTSSSSSDATLPTTSTDASTSAPSTSSTDPTSSSTADAESTTTDATSSTTAADTSSSSGGPSDTEYDELCTTFAAELEKCFPRDVDEEEQFMFCVEGLLCRANLTCEELEADNCVVFDGMIEKFCK